MAVPTATVASRSARPWGWVMSLTWCGNLRQQSVCMVNDDVVGVVVGGLECEGNKD